MISSYLPSAVKQAENNAILRGDTAFSMIETAARELLDYIVKENLDCRRVFILAGCGNNGSDGLVLGRLLGELGIQTDVFRVNGGKYSHENTVLANSVPLLPRFPASLSGYTLIIDCLYGIGFHGQPTKEDIDLINAVNQSSATVLSVDVPSGVNAADGSYDLAIRADRTCAMNCLKPAHLIYPGAEICGKVTLLDCDIPLPDRSETQSLSLSDLKFLPKRARRSNKGSFGRIAVVAGSKGMAGASYLSAKAALYSGAGLVEIFCPEENRIILQTLLPEAVLRVYTDATDLEELSSAVSQCDVMVLGPGLGRSRLSKNIVYRLLSDLCIPAVVDADGLNLCVGTSLLEEYEGELIVTPHPGEGARLLGCTVREVTDRILNSARTLSQRLCCTVLLKDAHTLICSKDRLNVNLSGNDGMATAGSGDVLTGIIAALLAQGLSAHDAAATAAYIHGLAGDLGAKKHGKRSLTASRITEYIEEVFKSADQPILTSSIEEM